MGMYGLTTETVIKEAKLELVKWGSYKEETMNTQITPHGHKKALSELKQWYTVHGPSANVTLMIDLSDGEIWADCFLDSNGWKEYHSSSIVPLQLPRDEFGQMVPPTMKNIKESAVKMLKKAV